MSGNQAQEPVSQEVVNLVEEVFRFICLEIHVAGSEARRHELYERYLQLQREGLWPPGGR
jgi:hypothetical protein